MRFLLCCVLTGAAWAQETTASHIVRARDLADQRDYAAALREVDAALKLDSVAVPALVLRGEVLTASGRAGEAVTLLDGVVSQHPESLDARYQLGLAHLADKRLAEAEASFQKLRQMAPTDVRGLIGLVEVAFARHAPDQAMQLVEGEVRKAPPTQGLQLLVANTALRAGSIDLAIAGYERLAAGLDVRSPLAAELQMHLGEAWMKKGDRDRALAYLRRGCELAPGRAEYAAALATAYDVAGRRTEARDAYEKVLQLDPNNALVMNNLAYLLAETGGDLTRALALTQQARERLPGVLEVWDTTGWIYVKAKMFDAAIGIYEGLVKKQPSSPMFHYHLGVALAEKGDREHARAELEEALAHGPEREYVSRILKLIRSLE